jgi:hypothetical protein
MAEDNGLATNEDGSDIFMGQSLDDFNDVLGGDIEEESDISSNEETIETTENISTNEIDTQSDNIKDKPIAKDSAKKSKFSKLFKLPKLPKISISSINISKKIKIILIVLLIIVAMLGYYFFIYTKEQTTTHKQTIEKTIKKSVKKKEKVINLSIINIKRLNKKLQILLEDEQERLNKTLEEEKIASEVLKKSLTQKKEIIQIATLTKKMDLEFSNQIELLNVDIKMCNTKTFTKIFAVVNSNNVDSILHTIHTNIAKDAFIVRDLDISAICQ